MTKIKTKATKLRRGGKRKGAGRPQGSGKYGEPTKAIRVPTSIIDTLQQYLTSYDPIKTVTPPKTYAALKNSTHPPLTLPLFEHRIPAGFPSPADDHLEMQLDLNEHLVKNPASTFYVRVEGDSMIGAGIHANDLLIVDLSLEPADGQVVIALIDGEFTVKRLKKGAHHQISLIAENKNYPPIIIKEGMDFKIWGVVTNVIHGL